MIAARTTLATLLVGVATLAAIPSAGAKDWPDPLLDVAGTPQNVAKGLELDAYQLGLSAYVWGYPLVRMERVARDYTDVPNPKPATSYRSPLNQIGWARELATPAALDMPTANNDTTYMSAVVDLSSGPYVLSVPEVGNRYYVVDVFNMWQELQHYIGRRTTGSKAGRFALVPPGWKGQLPAGVQRLDVATSKVWLWGRLQVVNGEDTKKVHALQDAFDLRPLTALANPHFQAPTAALAPLPDIGNDPLGFYRQLGAVLKDNPVRTEDKALAEQFARIGLTARGFDPSKLTESQRKGLLRAIQDGPLIPISSISQASEVRQGWNYIRGLDSFGYDYPLRAIVAGPYLGGQGEKEAVYPIRYTDSESKPLLGANDYALRFSGEPPNDAFWSLTIYDARTKMLINNSLQRYKFGSDTPGIQKSADGSFSLIVSPRKPVDGSNWLPAPSGAFYAILRIYQPRPEVISGAWKLPQLERVRK